MRTTLLVCCTFICWLTTTSLYSMSEDDLHVNLLPSSSAQPDVKEPADKKAHESVSIDINSPEAALEEIVVATPDYPVTEADTPAPYFTSETRSALAIRHLDCTGLHIDVQKIVASYLSNDWICTYTLCIDENLLDAVIAQNGTFFLTSGDTVKTWNLKTNKPTIAYNLNDIQGDVLSGAYKKFAKLAMSPNGRYLAAITDPNCPDNDPQKSIMISSINGETFIPFSNLTFSGYTGSEIAFSPHSRHFAALFNHKIIGHCAIEGHAKSLSKINGLVHNRISSLAMHPDDNHIAYTSYKTVSLRPLDKNKKTLHCSLPNNPNNQVNTYDHDFVSCAFKPDGKMLVAGSYDILLIWDLPNKTFKIYENRLQNSTSNDKWIRSLICTKDKIIYAIDTQIHILENCFSGNKLRTTVLNQDQRISRLSLSRNNILLSLTQDNRVKLWKSKANILDKNLAQSADLNCTAPEEQVARLSCCDKYQQWQLAHRKLLRCLLGIAVTAFVGLSVASFVVDKH